MPRLIDADELLKQAYDSHQWNNASQNFHQMVVDALDIEEAPTIDPWHYPSKGEYPTESGEYLVKVNYHDGKTPPFKSLCEFDTKYQKWCFYGNKDIVAWQYIEPPKEEA